jgi:preprotein translocase subunit SecA
MITRKMKKHKTVILSEAGVERVEGLLKSNALLLTAGGLYDAHNVSLVHHVNQALRAHKLIQRVTQTTL